MPATAVEVLLISAGMREEFRQPLADLHREAVVLTCASPREAAEYLRSAEGAPQLVVIAQSRPGEYLHAELDALVQLAPLARFVLLLGSWCEGETRTGRIWPGATRVFWYDWPGQLARNMAALASGRFAPWLAPVTTLEEERYLPDPAECRRITANATSERFDPRDTASPLVLVCTRRSSFGEALSSACRQQGYRAVRQRPDRLESIPGLAAIVWEGIQLLPAEIAELQSLATMWPRTPILALADFPRFETQERALAAGAAAIIAKPCLLDDVFGHLDRWCQDRTAQTAEHAA